MGFKQIARRAGETSMFLVGKAGKMTKAASLPGSNFLPRMAGPCHSWLHQGAVAFLWQLPDHVTMPSKLKKTVPLPQTLPVGETPYEMRPWLIQFKMVQAHGYRCAAYCDANGQWRSAYSNEALPGDIKVLW